MAHRKILAAGMLAAVLAAASPAALATDGYFSHGYGTRAKGMAGAGIALSLDSTSGAMNPASMFQIGNRMDYGMALFSPDRQYTVTGAPSGVQGTFGLAPGTVSSDRTLFGIPHFATNRMVDKKSSFGIILFGNGGMNTTYPASAGGGYGTFGGGQAGVNLEQLFVQPTYARKINDRVTAGVGVMLAYQRFEARGLSNFAPFAADGTPESLTNKGDDHAFGLGARLGVLYQAQPKLTLGATYQTQTTMSKFNKYSDLFAGQGAFDIPASSTVGLAYKTSATSVVAFDVQYIWYSAVHAIGNPFANLMTGMQQGNPGSMLGGANGVGFGWKDQTIYKLGYQWKPASDWTLRSGVSYGTEPIPSSEVLFNILAPGVQQWHFTFGFSKQLTSRSELTLAAMYSPNKTVTGPNPLEVPGQQTIGLTMHQFEVEASWGHRW